MTGSITDIVVPDSLVGSLYAEGQLRINVYRTANAVRLEAFDLTCTEQVHFTLSPVEAGALADIIRNAVQPAEPQT